MGKSLLKLSDNTYGQIAGEALLANVPSIMPRYSLVLYNQRHRVRYPETLSLPDVDAAKHVARRIANIFMDVVPYWGDLAPDQQARYVVEVMGEAGELLLTVPFRETTTYRVSRLKQRTKKKKMPHQDSSTDGAR